MNDDDESEFSRLIPGVKRLHNDRINVYQQRNRKKTFSANRQQDNQWQAEIPADSAPTHDTHFNTGLQKKLQRKIRQGLIRPEASLDLHGYRQAEALEVLEMFLQAMRCSIGMRAVLIIHGQGFRSQSDAVLKPLVQRWLANQSEVLAWCPALVRDGAAGASYVYLRTS